MRLQSSKQMACRLSPLPLRAAASLVSREHLRHQSNGQAAACRCPRGSTPAGEGAACTSFAAELQPAAQLAVQLGAEDPAI
jgi:hypothetical protein